MISASELAGSPGAHADLRRARLRRQAAAGRVQLVLSVPACASDALVIEIFDTLRFHMPYLDFRTQVADDDRIRVLHARIDERAVRGSSLSTQVAATGTVDAATRIVSKVLGGRR